MAKGGGNNAFALLPDDDDGDIDGFISEAVTQAKIREVEMKKKQQLQEQEEASKIKEQLKVDSPQLNRDPIPKRKPLFGTHTVVRKTKQGAETQGNVEENHKEKIGFLENNQNVVNNNHKGNYGRNFHRNTVRGGGGDNGYKVDYNRVDNRRNVNGGDQKFNNVYQGGDNNSIKNFNGGDQGYNGNQRDNNVRNFNGVGQRYKRGGEVYYRENHRNFNRGDNGYQRPNLYQRTGNFNQQNNNGDLQNGFVYSDEPDAEGYIVYHGHRKGRKMFHGNNNNNDGSSEHTSNNGSDNAEKKVEEESDKPEEKVVEKLEGKVVVVEEAAESKNGDEKKEAEKADAESKEEEKKKDKKEKMKKKNSKAGDLYHNKKHQQQQRKEDENFQDNTKTYKEYEKLLLAKKKALEVQLATNTALKPKATLDEAFASMKPIGKASEKPKFSSSAESLKNREKGTKPVNITADFINPPLRRSYRRVPQVVEGEHNHNNGGGPNVDRAPPTPPPPPPPAAAPAPPPPPCITDLDQFPSL